MNLNSPETEPEPEIFQGGHPLGKAVCPRKDLLLEHPGRGAEEMAAKRCCDRDTGSAWVSPAPTQPLPVRGQGLLSRARSFFWARRFGRTLLFPAVKWSLNSRLGAEMAS